MMDTLERQQLYNTAWKHWGPAMQIDMLIEEMAELTQALLKARRNGITDIFDPDYHNTQVYEELADVTICLEQLETRLKKYPRPSVSHTVGVNGVAWDCVLDFREEKLTRLERRLLKSLAEKHAGIGGR
jgi:NTP pyrophosphatase (non-canonical NTP hydrolase)